MFDVVLSRVLFFLKGDLDERGHEPRVFIGVEDHVKQAVHWSGIRFSPTGECPAHLSLT